MADEFQLKVVTGLSGSGISTALDTLEDQGWFCVDNLPPPLLPKLFDLARGTATYHKLAIGLDARSVVDATASVQMLRKLRADGAQISVLYLEASDVVLLRRYSTSRRPHPLASEGRPLPEVIEQERHAMHALREVAAQVIDTSAINVHELKRAVQVFASGVDGAHGLALAVTSFGFRHGLPLEADLVWDVRFLPNPYFIEALRPLSGLMPVVAEHVLQKPVTRAFLARFLPLLDTVLPAYEHEGKSYLTLAIGCTGGRHRSVAIAERVGRHLREAGRDLTVRHRDIDKEAT